MSSETSAWARVPLGEIAAKIVDGSHNPPREASSGHPMLSARNVENGRLIWNSFRLVGEADFEREHARTRIASGDVLLTIVGSIGRTTVVRDDEKLFTLQRSVAVLSVPDLDPDFVSYQFQAPLFQQLLAKEARGTAQKGVYLRTLGSAEVTIAPLAEQHRIVEALDSYLSRLDAAVANLERVQAKLKAYRSSVLKAAVEGRLVPTEAAIARQENRDYEPAEALLARILKDRRRRWEEAELARLKKAGKPPKDDKWKAKYEEPSPPDTSKLPEVPEGWCWTTVAHLAEVTGGLTKNGARENVATRLPYLRVANVYANTLVLDEMKEIGVDDDELPRVLVEAGDLLIVEGNGSVDQIGRVARWDGSISPVVHQNHLIKARFTLRPIERWTLTWLLSPGGRNAIVDVATSTSGLHTLSISKIEKLPVPLPPLDEQQRVLDDVDHAMSIVDVNEKAVGANRRRSVRLRQAVLKWAFEGKLVDQDPADEPADKLLARIRAERSAASPTKKTRGRKAKAAS